VEAWQHVKLTGTNRSIGFIALIIRTHPTRRAAGNRQSAVGTTPAPRTARRPDPDPTRCAQRRPRDTPSRLPTAHPPTADPPKTLLIFAGLVAMAGRQTPDPIPNSAVKLPSANGTSSRRRGRVGRCQACKDQKTNHNHTRHITLLSTTTHTRAHTQTNKGPAGISPRGLLRSADRRRWGRASRWKPAEVATQCPAGGRNHGRRASAAEAVAATHGPRTLAGPGGRLGEDGVSIPDDEGGGRKLTLGTKIRPWP
jgi:hypothetical protein